MAKRFSDSDKWKKPWFRKLKPIHKIFWEYLRDNCNNAGIWNVDFDLASFLIGETINQEKTEEALKKQFIKIDNSKWYLIDFIEWQYNCLQEDLNPSNKAHLSVIKILKKYKIKGVSRGLEATKNKDKDKNKNKDKNKRTIITKQQFETIWKTYPGKTEQKGSKSYALEVLTRDKYKFTYEQTLTAITNYAKASEQVAKGIVYNLSTFVNKGFVGQWLEETAIDSGAKEKTYIIACPDKCKGSTKIKVDSLDVFVRCEICNKKKVLMK